MRKRSVVGAGGFLAAGLLGACTVPVDHPIREINLVYGAPAGSIIPAQTPAMCLGPLKADHTVKLYIGSGPYTLLPSLVAGKLGCKHCLAYSGVSKSGLDDDDDGMPDNGRWLPAAGSAVVLPPLWPTPFDMDIYDNKPLLGMSPSGQYKPILIKIILRDTSLQFYQPNDPNHPLESKWAVVAAGDNTLLLSCRGPITKANRTATPPIPYDFVTIKVGPAPHANPGSAFTAINIGIMTKQGPSYMPIYFDPNVKSNG